MIPEPKPYLEVLLEKAKKVKCAWRKSHKSDRRFFTYMIAIMLVILLAVIVHYPWVGMQPILLISIALYVDMQHRQNQDNAQRQFLGNAVGGVTECLHILLRIYSSILGVLQSINSQDLVDRDKPFKWQGNIPSICVFFEKIPGHRGVDVKDVRKMLNKGIKNMAQRGEIYGFPRAMVGEYPAFVITDVWEDDASIFLNIAMLDYPDTMPYLAELERTYKASKQHTPKPPITHEFD